MSESTEDTMEILKNIKTDKLADAISKAACCLGKGIDKVKDNPDYFKEDPSRVEELSSSITDPELKKCIGEMMSPELVKTASVVLGAESPLGEDICTTLAKMVKGVVKNNSEALENSLERIKQAQDKEDEEAKT